MTTGEAEAQMHPATTGLQAFFTAVGSRGYIVDLVGVCAACHAHSCTAFLRIALRAMPTPVRFAYEWDTWCYRWMPRGIGLCDALCGRMMEAPHQQLLRPHGESHEEDHPLR